MHLLIRLSSVRYGIIDTEYGNGWTRCAVIRTFNDDRGFSANALIREAQEASERTITQSMILGCLPVRGG